MALNILSRSGRNVANIGNIVCAKFATALDGNTWPDVADKDAIDMLVWLIPLEEYQRLALI